MTALVERFVRTHDTGARIPRGRRTLTLTLLAAALIVGPLRGESAAATCGAGPSSTQRIAALAPIPTGIEATRIRWTRWHSRIVFGDAATLEGQVVTDEGALPGAAVDLLARPAGSNEWKPVRSTETDHDTGVFSFPCLRPDLSTDYRVVYDGTLYYAGSTGERSTAVARRMADSMHQPDANRFRFSGRVAPDYADQPVLLQSKRCPTCRWSTVARKDTSARSTWRFTIRASSFQGRRWFRAVIAADDQYARSHSDRVWRLTSR